MNTGLKKLNKIILIIIAIAGILISGELLVVYYNANFNPEAGPSFCAVNEYINCDAVAETVYSRFLGIPLALWGLGFYSFILLLLLFPFNKFRLFEVFQHPGSYIFTLASFSVVVSVVLFYITYFVIEKVCMLCQYLYITNALLFLASKSGKSAIELYKNTFVDLKNIIFNKTWRKIVIFIGIIWVISLVLINIYTPFTPGDTVTETKVQNYYKIGTIGNILGSKDAKLVIEEYTDYECPYCSISNGMMLRLTKEVKGVRVEHYDFPLDKECNPFVKNSLHKNSCKAIYYAKAARKQGKFWDLATLLYENREDLSEKNILKLAKSIDLDIEQLKKDAAMTEKYKEEIKKDITRADKLGIEGTPSYVIGIKKYEGIMPYSELKKKVLENL